MNRLSRLLVLTRFARQKRHLFLLFLAIAAASCLVVWIVGGYQNLFSEIIHTNNRPFGKYDLELGAPSTRSPNTMRGRGGGFGGPLAKRPNPGMGQGGPGIEKGAAPDQREQAPQERFDPLKPARSRDGAVILERIPEEIPSHIRNRLLQADVNGDGLVSRTEEEQLFGAPFEPAHESHTAKNEPSNQRSPLTSPRAGQRGERRSVSIPESLLDEICTDPDLRHIDKMRHVQGFIFARGNSAENGPENTAGIPQNSETDTKAEPVPNGIDPDLHREGLTAYRARMGTPMGLGESFIGTDAEEPPAELEKGRWFTSGESAVYEAVLSTQAAEKYNAVLGDPILILTKTDEFQVTVVGIIEDRNLNSFYVPLKTADIIAGTPSSIDTVGIVLTSSDNETAFKSRWEEKIEKAVPGIKLTTKAEFIKAQEANLKAASAFRMQAVTGTILAILASMMIILTALTIGIEQRRREIGLLRSVGISSSQVAGTILTESLFLAIPGWLGGLLAGWLILCLLSGSPLALNGRMIGFSFLCTVIGSIAAAVVPILNACRVRPLEAVTSAREEPTERFSVKTRRRVQIGIFLLGLVLIACDFILIYGIRTDRASRAALHSGFGITALAFGVLCLIPILVRLAEKIFLPVLAFFFRFDRTLSASELSNHIRRTSATAAMLAIGGGLFVLMQIWGYSMLAPFLPNEQMPDAFAAFLPQGLTDENAAALLEIPRIKKEEFEPVAVEQAAFAPNSIPNGRGGDFANVVLFGMDVDRAFAGNHPLVKLDFLEGNRETALNEIRGGRGVIVNDALTIDYGFKLGDTLRLCDPKQNARILEYSIVGIVSFNGWQWLSKTGGVRRNYGRSGGILFTSSDLVRTDYHLTGTSYFWFNLEPGTDCKELETALDAVARKNLADLASSSEEAGSPDFKGRELRNGKKIGNAAYVKLSTRKSLRDSIEKRADGVIWGLSTMPLVTLALMSIALAAVTVNSVQTRRRSFGILRSIGVERSKLVRMILAESLLLALTAAAASLLFGIPAALGTLKLGQSIFGTADPNIVFPIGLLFGLGFLMILAIAAAVIPAVRIGRAKPLELLREGKE